MIAPIIGIASDLPVIPLLRPKSHRPRWCWKAEQIRGWVGHRAFVWFNDEINGATRAWLDAQVGLGPHLARRVAADVDLTDEDFAAFSDFAVSL